MKYTGKNRNVRTENSVRAESSTDLPKSNLPAPLVIGKKKKLRSIANKIAITRDKTHNLLTHFPKDPECPMCIRATCTRARVYAKKGKTSQDTFLPKEFADSIILDFMDVKDDRFFGRRGERHALTIVDRAKKWSHVFPCNDKSAESVRDSLLRFLGPGVNPKHLYS